MAKLHGFPCFGTEMRGIPWDTPSWGFIQLDTQVQSLLYSCSKKRVFIGLCCVKGNRFSPEAVPGMAKQV
jgi:hypothetical protein